MTFRVSCKAILPPQDLPQRHPARKNGDLLAQAARNQTQGVEETLAVSSAHSGRVKEGRFVPATMSETVGRQEFLIRGIQCRSHAHCPSKEHTNRRYLEIPRACALQEGEHIRTPVQFLDGWPKTGHTVPRLDKPRQKIG